MKKEELAKNVNAIKDLGRAIVVNYEIEFTEGQIYDNRGKAESWTDRDSTTVEFQPETAGSITYILQCDRVPCHVVDYNNKEETDALGATGCESEAECLVSADTKMRITYVSSEWDFEEMGYYLIELEVEVD